ncbi:hypothetical protein QUF72_07695 [Desulfobacterales bacterium HSG2]|nr:hypothetical protein [Desulfobacterales bacterium HSG2]
MIRKIISMAIVALGIMGILSGGTFAGEAGKHYVNGVEGLKASSLPPPIGCIMFSTQRIR